MSRFKVGDVCIIRPDPTITKEQFLRFNGEEVRIVENNRNIVNTTLYRYKVSLMKDGFVLYCHEHELRLPYDGNKVVSWDECAWRPKELVHD